MASSAPGRSGSDGHHPQPAVGRPEEPFDDVRVGIGHELRVLGTTSRRRQERPLEVDPGDMTAHRRITVENLPDAHDGGQQFVHRRRDEAEQHRCRPVGDVKPDPGDDVVGIAGRERCARRRRARAHR